MSYTVLYRGLNLPGFKLAPRMLRVIQETPKFALLHNNWYTAE